MSIHAFFAYSEFWLRGNELMQLDKPGQIFSIFDTNGRRGDVMNAYQIYVELLDQLNIAGDNVWAAWPKSFNQLHFYRGAIEASPTVFKIHSPYDKFQKLLEVDDEFSRRFEQQDGTLKKDDRYKKAIADYDVGVESRARHYTSNLVTMGFATVGRELTDSGRELLNSNLVNRDMLEKALPIKDANLVLLRQALRLRVYDHNDTVNYYSPFKLALYLLLGQDTPMMMKTLTMIMQLVNPGANLTGRDLWALYQEHGQDGILDQFGRVSTDDGDDLTERAMIANAKGNLLGREQFGEIYLNRKSSETVDVYYEFYQAVYEFAHDKTQDNLNKLRALFMDDSKKSDALKKAFGFGSAVFVAKRGRNGWVLATFLKENANNHLLNQDEVNEAFYKTFVNSKRADSIKETMNTTQKVLEATGLFEVENGIVSLLNKDILDIDAIKAALANDVFGSEDMTVYEKEFTKSASLLDIFRLEEADLFPQFDEVREKYGLESIDGLPKVLAKKRDDEFKEYIEENFPREKVFELLGMFSNRDNDTAIRKAVSVETDVPTIYEYVVGLAWYYLSDDKTYDLYRSFNLAMNGNFRPVSHAPGGDGDIIIDYTDKQLMIEVTLMNKQAQKRGEWEPVLRHSVNMSVESDKPTTTLFVADTLDLNTINIWRAVAAVPLESTRGGAITEDVVQIMPIKGSELIDYSANTRFSSEKLLANIDESFAELREQEFDMSWRNDILTM